jgi:hypothetical protein
MGNCAHAHFTESEKIRSSNRKGDELLRKFDDNFHDHFIYFEIEARKGKKRKNIMTIENAWKCHATTPTKRNQL